MMAGPPGERLLPAYTRDNRNPAADISGSGDRARKAGPSPPQGARRASMAVWPIRARDSPLPPVTSSTSPSWLPPTTRCTPTRARSGSACRSARPGTAVPRSARRSTRTTSSPPPRRSATTGRGHGIDGPLYLGADTHALAEPAQASALEVLAANGVRVLVDARGGYTPTPAISRAILAHNPAGRGAANHGASNHGAQADGIVVTPSHNPPADGGFKYNPPDGGPAGTEVTREIQDRANELLADGLSGVRRVPYARALAADTTGTFDFLDSYVAALDRVVDLAAVRGRRDPHRRRPARRGERRVLGRDRRALRPQPHRGQPRGGPDVPVHDPGLGRQDPDGLLVAVRDGQPDQPAARVHDRDRERHRLRPARHRHAGRRADEPEPLPRGRHRLPVPAPGRLAARPRRSARRWSARR